MQLMKDNHQYKILILADIQIVRPVNAKMRSYLETLINVSKPDFMVLLGDMIYGPMLFTERSAYKAIHSILAIITEKGIPFTIVSGNHDQDTRVLFEEQVKLYHNAPGCVTPLVRDRECAGAYYVDICRADQTIVSRLLFLDSGSTCIDIHGIGYSPATKEQINYSSKAAKGVDDRPVFVFQHVPVPEIYQLFDMRKERTQGAVRGKGPYRGKYLSLRDDNAGYLGESPCPSFQNTEQLNGWASDGNIVAAFFGHDHKNSFVGNLKDVALVQVSCAGLTCYGTDALRGGQLLTIKEDGTWHTEALYYKNIIQ